MNNFFRTSVGNKRFRLFIENRLETYLEAKTKKEKSIVVSSIVEVFRANARPNGGGFIRKVRTEVYR